MPDTRRSCNRSRYHVRRGHVAVEFAMVVPLVFLFFWAAIDIVRFGILRHVADTASYEAARCVIVPGANIDEAKARADEVLATFGIQNATTTVTPNPIRETTAAVTVRVEALVDSNSWILPRFTKGKKLVSETTLLTERAPAVQIAAIEYEPPAPEDPGGYSSDASPDYSNDGWSRSDSDSGL